jgi:hypothetical protein
MMSVMKRFLQRGWQYSVLIGVGAFVKTATEGISTSLEKLAENNFLVSGIILGTLATYLAISYRQYRDEKMVLVQRAEVAKAAPSSKESDWAPLIYESKKRWKGRRTVIYAMLSVIANLIFLAIFLALTSLPEEAGSFADNSAFAVFLFPFIAIALKYGWDQYEESLECKDAEELLKAANEGHWVPMDDESEDDAPHKPGTVHEIFEKVAEEAPEEAIKIVMKSI